MARLSMEELQKKPRIEVVQQANVQTSVHPVAEPEEAREDLASAILEDMDDDEDDYDGDAESDESDGSDEPAHLAVRAPIEAEPSLREHRSGGRLVSTLTMRFRDIQADENRMYG